MPFGLVRYWQRQYKNTSHIQTAWLFEQKIINLHLWSDDFTNETEKYIVKNRTCTFKTLCVTYPPQPLTTQMSWHYRTDGYEEVLRSALFWNLWATVSPAKDAIEGLHDAVRTYTRMTLPRSLVSSLYITRYGEKQQNLLLLLIYFIARFEISTECVF